MLLVKFNILGTILNTQNTQETNLSLNSPFMCWLNKHLLLNKHFCNELKNSVKTLVTEISNTGVVYLKKIITLLD